ncbi:MAG TPA: dodecin family protein [Candidatus Thermoplasmatota archaeon]|nr:dodecin family protein [Candidatus Thermoplasmatota archaeon]
MAQNPQMQQKKDERTAESDTWHRTAKVIELIGNSKESFEDAVQSALTDATRSLRHISGADVIKFSVKCEEGRILEYRVDLKVAFGIEGNMGGNGNSRM